MGASIKIGDKSLYLPAHRMRAYRNLTKKCWSVMNRYTGRVIFHADALTLTHCKFEVRDKGRRRVLKEKRKNVHAFVDGTMIAFKRGEVEVTALDLSPTTVFATVGRIVTYNPYTAGYFFQKTNRRKVERADVVEFREDGTVKAFCTSGRGFR